MSVAFRRSARSLDDVKLRQHNGVVDDHVKNPYSWIVQQRIGESVPLIMAAVSVCPPPAKPVSALQALPDGSVKAAPPAFSRIGVNAPEGGAGSSRR